MDVDKALRAYNQQRRAARSRGIEWQFTFKTWAEWWGDDIEQRGVGQCKLQMQRLADTGPYAPDNVRKGFPRDNAKTAGRMARLRNSLRARQEIERALDMAETATEKESPDLSDDELELQKMFRPQSSLCCMFIRGR